MSEAPLDHISRRFALPVMRSVMTVPVIVERFVEKAPSSGADVLCLDLEDSVPPDEKLAPGSLVFTPPDHPVELDQLANWCRDAETRRAILVDNPARLYGF